jgi:hypothetical protein
MTPDKRKGMSQSCGVTINTSMTVTINYWGEKKGCERTQLAVNHHEAQP